MERKKTKVLKQALKQERKDRQVIEQELEKTKEQIAEMNTQIQDKVRNRPQVKIPFTTGISLGFCLSQYTTFVQV